MSTLRGNAHRTLGTPVQVTVRPITLALAALAVAAVLAFAIVLAANSGNGGQDGFAKSVRVVPSAPIPPSPVERHQQSGLDGPGLRP
jgi:hypothetical protein